MKEVQILFIDVVHSLACHVLHPKFIPIQHFHLKLGSHHLDCVRVEDLYRKPFAHLPHLFDSHGGTEEAPYLLASRKHPLAKVSCSLCSSRDVHSSADTPPYVEPHSHNRKANDLWSHKGPSASTKDHLLAGEASERDQYLIDLRHDALHEQSLDNLPRTDSQPLGNLLDGHALWPHFEDLLSDPLICVPLLLSRHLPLQPALSAGLNFTGPLNLATPLLLSLAQPESHAARGSAQVPVLCRRRPPIAAETLLNGEEKPEQRGNRAMLLYSGPV